MSKAIVPRHWRVREADEVKINQLLIDLGIHRILARVMVARGIAGETSAEQFLNPQLAALGDPFQFAGMQAGCDRFVRAIVNNEVIGVFGDYDVDGVTSTVLLCEFLESCGVQVCATIPDRIKEGYGLNVLGLERLAKQGATLVVTVDCGITAHEEVLVAVEKGIDVVVIDHHTVPVDLPKAVAVINPHRSDCARQAKHLCAVGVVFNLCMALRKQLRDLGFFADKPEPNLLNFLDLVALGTVADVVPLILENRIFVHHGVNLIKKQNRLGINALLETAKIPATKITASTLGFQLGPRVNAAGRLEDAMQAVNLLRTSNVKMATDLANFLNDSNLSRRALEREMVDEAILEINNSEVHQDSWVIVIGKEHWHPGVVGIVASRLVEKFGKPTIVIGANGKGSGRSIPSFHLHESLCQVAHIMTGFGGHAHAVGVHLEFDKIAKLREELNLYSAKILTKADLVQTMSYDGELSVFDVSFDLVNELNKAAPYGRGNPEPVFRLNKLTFANLKELNQGHLRGQIAGDRRVPFVAFGLAEKIKLFEDVADILVSVDINEWMGKKEIQLKIKDIKAHEAVV